MSEYGIYLYAVTPDAGGDATAGTTGDAGPGTGPETAPAAGEDATAGTTAPGGGTSGLHGVLGGPVRPIRHAGLVAHVGEVPLDQFGEGPLRRLLEDLDWVEGVARAHHHVVEALAAAGPVAPVRLVTVYTGEDQVRDLLDRRRDDFADLLARVAGRHEWGVKAYVTRAAPPAPTAEPAPGRGSTSPGTAYLQRRKASLRSREDVWRAAAERAERLHAALGEIAVAGRRHRPQDPQLSGRNDVMVLNGAYLVDPDRDGEFAAALDAFRGEGMDVELTGPWAPYSFTSLDLGSDRGGGAR
ncbi:GvpL/GvpF family gas vesicle protein [Microbispora sp. ATCC PTA-5024]|uniref:GvpL/GvpF family gas vesicle protein n=1 Tax=Microbispora sp. ATCC PTA-5024 TaxID=316330 RepID=UPI0003DC4897|nr:GvpL/GvpF family gas vesicle protein [Microbispora sp. ATCC PTA-5024]ETK35508.1 gas vesicle synthesis GvpLF [Microbispora sp. ATCC PTA-5024]